MKVAALTSEEREAIIADLDPDTLQYDWSFWGRPEQHVPDYDNWSVFLLLAGRGFGKTRCASEWVRNEAKKTNRGQLRFALVARTAADVRDVLVEGESGILNVTPESERPNYEPSKRRLTWPNGNVATCFTADEPDSLRGPAFTHAWGDEVAAWKQTPDSSGLTAFDNLRIGTRLGAYPKLMLTTTPKRVPLLYTLLKEAEDEANGVIVRRGATIDNAGNLHSSYLDAVLGIYEGTALAKQELMGEMLSEIDGALWVLEQIQSNTVGHMPAGVPLRIIGVDPTVAERPGDECGIIVVASTGERDLYKRRAWVLEDATIKGAPDVWANQVVRMARKWGCPVVAEKNQGGALIRNAITAIDPSIVVLDVWSKDGKHLRAEPVTLAYQQGRVQHVGYMAELVDQMTTWIPSSRGKSPDRVDALVHALTALLIKPPTGFIGGQLSAKSMASRKLPKFAKKSTFNIR
jgi:phage terminase large subunit-like protein